MLTELGETLEAISVSNFSFSPSPVKLSKIQNIEPNHLEPKTIKKNNREKLKKSKKFSRNNKIRPKFKKQVNQESIELSNKNIKGNCEVLNLDTRGIIVEVEPITDNKIAFGQMIDNNQLIDEHELSTSEKIVTTPSSFGSNKSFSYSKWIKKESIKNFIRRYIPRFLIPAFKAIENLRIRFATPTKIIETQQKTKSKKEVKKKMKFKRK